MPPQKLIECLKNLQDSSNAVTIAHIAVSQAVGEYLEFLCSTEDFTKAYKYTDKLQKCFSASADALMTFCDASKAISQLRAEDMLYE